MVFDVMINAKRRMARQRAKLPLSVIAEKAFDYHMSHKAVDLACALRTARFSVIGELKKATPGGGTLREAYHPQALAAELVRGGAAALAVFTEPSCFQGDCEDLKGARGAAAVPIVRMDCLFDEWQLCESCLLGADAVFLTTALLDVFMLKKLIAVAEMLGMQSVVEVRSEEQVRTALRAGAEIIAAGNRDHTTYDVDLRVTERLRPFVPKEVVFVAEGGVGSPEDLRCLREAGADAVTVGELLMRAPLPGKALADLLSSV